MCPRVRSLKSFHKFAPLIPTTCVVQDPCIWRHTHSLHKLRCPRMTSLDGSLPTASGRRRCCHRHAKRKLAKTAQQALFAEKLLLTHIYPLMQLRNGMQRLVGCVAQRSKGPDKSSPHIIGCAKLIAWAIGPAFVSTACSLLPPKHKHAPCQILC